MLCHACHVHLHRAHPYCLHCGTPRRGVRVDRAHAPTLRRVSDPAVLMSLTRPVTTVGRALDNDLVLDDPSVSRRHARIVRGRDGFTIEDLDSFNGTTVAGRKLHGDRAPLPDSGTVCIGDVALVFAHPRAAAVGGKTVLAVTEQTILPVAAAHQPAPTATEPLSARPRRRSGWALKQAPEPHTAPRWVLRNTRTGQYLQLDERDVFLWELLDGEHTLRDLLFAYAERYGELALPRIEQTLRTLARADLIRGLPGQTGPVRLPWPRRLGRAVFKALLRMEVSVGGLDRLFSRMYRSFGWWFFTGAGVAGLWLLILAGLYGFWLALDRQRLLDLGGAGAWGVAAIAVGYLAAIAVHEAAHALAVKSYGRTVTRGGFMLMLGMPFAFVDTSDMWFGSRWSRIVVAVSGPLSTAGIAGGLSLAAAYLPHRAVSALCFQLAFGLYLNTCYNLNPLMPLDGYQALADALRRPRLREEATAYVTTGFWRDLRAGRRPGLRQLGLAGYGLFAMIGLGLFLVMAFLAWRSRLGELVADHLSPPVQTLVVVLGLGLVLFPIWYRIVRMLTGLVTRRGRRASGTRAETAETGEAIA